MMRRQQQYAAKSIKEKTMCKECGCGLAESTTHLQFFVKGYTEENAAAVEKALLGLPGVLYVHIHTHDGETQCCADIKRFYPQADAHALWRMLNDPASFFTQYRHHLVLM